MLARALLATAVLCVLLLLACWLGTGSDERNMGSIASYPKAVRDRALADPRLARMAPRERPTWQTFLANLVLFSAVLALAGLVVRPAGLAEAFAALLAMGEALNLFDLLAIDLVWWRHSPRVRLSGIDDASLYLDPRPHVASFGRGVPLFALAALLAALVVCAL